LSTAAVGASARSHVLALELYTALTEAEKLALMLEDAAYEEAEPGLVYAARGVRERLAEGRGLLAAVLRAKKILGGGGDA